MNRLLSILALITLTVVAQTVVIEEGTSFELSYDHNSVYTTKIFTNGVLHRTYAPSEVRLVSTGSTNNVYAVTLSGLQAKNYVFTATVVTPEGMESDPSNQLTVSLKPRKPGNLRKFN